MELNREQDLCLSCRGLDFDVLFKDIIDTDSTDSTVHHTLQATCPLCDLFLSAVAESDRPKTTAVTLVRDKVLRPAGRERLYETEWPTRTALAVDAVDAAGNTAKDGNLRVEYCRAPDEPILLDPKQVDYEPLRFWCRKIQAANDHTMDDLQQLKGPPGEEDILPRRVIDCHDRTIVPVQAPCDYFTLSYVWGPAAVQDAPAGDALPTNLPRTVEDAMTVVRELGYRFLWVDRYCLDQSNKAEFQTQLNQMADIYRHGFACIIGAAGEDADYGLPGVSTRARTNQTILKVGDYTIWRSMPHQTQLVSESKWATRAWTYQEGVFSSDWFTFTDEQVFFRRANRGMYNQRRWWKDSCERSPNGTCNGCTLTDMGYMYDSVYNNEGYIHRQLSLYTTRTMSFQSDAVNAMLGILKRCGNGPYPMNHYFGVPILGPLINHRLSIARDSSRSWSLTEAFLVNLCWTSENTGPRRTEFPSWSWAGWRATYKRPYFSLGHLGLSLDNDFMTTLSVQVDGKLVEWETMCRARDWAAYMDPTKLPRELYLEAPIVSLTVCRDPRDEDPSWASPEANCHAASLAPMGFCAIFSDEDCDVLIGVDLVDAEVASAITSAGSVSLRGVLLRKERLGEKADRQHPVRLFALVVREDSEGSTRVGSLELRADNHLVRWKTDVTQHEVEEASDYVGYDHVEFAKCSECARRAMRSIIASRRDGVVKIL
ncbi:hypothetical protein ACHAQA_005995 [Verticillium albo-atrum]